MRCSKYCGKRVPDQNNQEINARTTRRSTLQSILKQRFLTAQGELDMSDIMSGIQGADYLVYASLSSVRLIKGKKIYDPTLDETYTLPGKLHLKGSISIHDVKSADLKLYRTVEYNRIWENSEDTYLQWTRLFSEMTDEMCALTLITLQPLSIAWSQGDLVGLNHGRASGLKKGDCLKIYSSKNSVSKYMGDCRIIGFGPQGKAEAKVLTGGIMEQGMLAKLEKPVAKFSNRTKQAKQKAAEKRKPAW